MPTARHTLLKWLSAAVWYIGAGMLLWKGAERLIGAAAALGSVEWPVTVGLLAVGLGVIQGQTVFRRSCVRNLHRIRALESPRLWQFFRPSFFVALAVMIGGAVVLSILADRGPIAALAVAGVDWLIGFSLLVSSLTFWAGTPESDSEGYQHQTSYGGQAEEAASWRESRVQRPESRT
ncbi:MAG: hypothetical protein ACN0LA_08280 [Candidatus Longimicrobiales bacterium M2_2A_002]